MPTQEMRTGANYVICADSLEIFRESIQHLVHMTLFARDDLTHQIDPLVPLSNFLSELHLSLWEDDDDDFIFMDPRHQIIDEVFGELLNLVERRNDFEELFEE